MMDEIKIINAAEGDVFKQEEETQLDTVDIVHADVKTEDSVDFDLVEPPELHRASSISSISDAIASLPPSELALSIASTPSLPSSPTSSTTSSSPKPLKTKICTERKQIKNRPKRVELLKRHCIDQALLLTQISKSIKSIKRSLRDLKNYEVKILKLEEERSKREEEKQLMDMKIKKLELSIQIKKLQLQIDTAHTK